MNIKCQTVFPIVTILMAIYLLIDSIRLSPSSLASNIFILCVLSTITSALLLNAVNPQNLLGGKFSNDYYSIEAKELHLYDIALENIVNESILDAICLEEPSELTKERLSLMQRGIDKYSGQFNLDKTIIKQLLARFLATPWRERDPLKIATDDFVKKNVLVDWHNEKAVLFSSLLDTNV